MKIVKINTAGQITALITQTKLSNKSLVSTAKKLMIQDSTVEQVGLVNSASQPQFRMMGGELSVNGTLAAAYWLFTERKLGNGSLQLKTSGIDELVEVSKKDNFVSVMLPTSIASLSDSGVTFVGISYLLVPGFNKERKLSAKQEEKLKKMSMSTTAAGIVFFENNQIQPVVYVRSTNTLVWENACGSGSIAFFLATGRGKVVQPSGDVIRISKNDATLCVSVSAKEVKMSKQLPQTLKGFRDFLPAEAQQRQWLKNRIVEVFELWGYDPIETPTLEPLELFKGQIGDEENLFFQFTDAGGRDVAMRYDQTVPACRVVAQNYQQLPMPFRRYQIQSSFRAEKPQKGRYREFTQCDADIFGSDSPIADAEVIALGLDVYRSLGFPQAVVSINDRALMRGLPYAAIVAIDKIEKIGADGVIEEMVKKGIDLAQAKDYLKQVQDLQPNDTINTILNFLKMQGFSSEWYKFDPTIARSFSYSTGPIWEIKVPGFSSGSVLGGERFDELTEKIAGVRIPATGFGLGFDRTIEAAGQFGLLPKTKTATQVLVTVFDSGTLDASLLATKKLRENGVCTELFPNYEKLGKQFKYADKKGIPFALIIGEDERKQNKVQLKNLRDGTQQLLTIAECIAVVGVTKNI